MLTWVMVAATAALVTAQRPLALAGTVFLDANANGIRDRGELGLEHVAVSNQEVVVLTDANGGFRIGRGPTGVVFVSVPSGHRPAGEFWRRVTDTTTDIQFALRPAPAPDELTFVHASDPHVAPAVVGRMQRFRAMVDSLRPAFVIITGDLVRDAMRVGEAEATGYYDLLATELSRLVPPVWTVPGNHEIFGIERTQSKVDPAHPLFGRKMYHHYRGPDYYSFNAGGVHFVGLNTIDVDDQWYYGHVDSLQLAWLERDLAVVPASTPVVTFNHIPFFSSSMSLGGYSDAPPAPTLITVKGKTVFRHVVSNAGEALAILRTRRHVLALGGHVHANEHIVYGVDGAVTRFNQSAAIVGAQPAAGLAFVSGFTVYTIRKGEVDAGGFVPLGIDRPR